MESSTPISVVPALADSDIELWTDCLGDYISAWLRNSPQFIEDHQQKMLRMALCPFLFGVTHNLPQAWQEILHTYGIIEKERENKTTPLNEVELEILEMAETIFMRCSQLVGNKNDLKTILNFIYDVEERSALLGRIDMNYALQEVNGLEVFASMWAPIKRIYERRKRQAHVCIIYYFTIISHHVTNYGQNGIDKADYVKRMLSEINRAEREGSVTLTEGNKAFNDGDFKLAVERYSSVIEREPLNSLLYSNRAQAYLNLCDYRSALCDSKRAIILDPRNSKHYFRAAKSYLELGQLDKSEDFNNLSLKCCSDPLQKEAILQQNQEILAKSNRMTKASENIISSGSEEREINNPLLQYRRLLCEGSNSYLANAFNRAVEQFKSALDMLSRPENQIFSVREDELLVVWFVYGMACVKSANLRNLQTAVEKFSAVISHSQTFPAAYYGLGLAYMALKRYKDAEEVLKTGLEKIKECRDNRVYIWPQINKAIEETDIPTVKTLMEDLVKECMYPPKPDAVCKFHTDTDSSKKEIYVSDPDYKGHICIKCRANCSIEFHLQCWKTNDSYTRGKHNWKEMLDMPCPTPGCWGLISDVYICRPDQEKSLKLSSQMEIKTRPHQVRPKLKMKTESQSKLERKMEKKRLRKERAQEARLMSLELENDEQESQNTAARVFQPHQGDEVDNRNIDQTGTLLHKDEPEVLVEQKKQRTNKTKKKEKKYKQFLTFDVQFKGDEDKERYGVNSLDDDGDFVNTTSTVVNPGLLPTPGSGPSMLIDRSQSLQAPSADWNDMRLYDFFHNILIMNGPMDLFGKEFEAHTKNLSEEAQTRIHHYGGLVSFLSCSPRFSVSQDNIVRAVLPGQQGAPPRGPQENPWEVKNNKIEESQLVWLNLRLSLNPGAKEFVPQETAAASVLSNSQVDSYATIAKSGTNELPAPAEDNDDGFTTVVSKKRLHQHGLPSVVQPNVKKYNILKPASSYNSVDEISLESQLSRKAFITPIESIDDVNKEKEEEANYETEMLHGSISSQDAKKYSFLRPVSSYNSVDEISLESNLSRKGFSTPIERVDVPNKEKREEAKYGTKMLYGSISSLDTHWSDSLEKQPARNTTAAAPKAVSTSGSVVNTRHGSDASDVSGDDLRRVSSPALSTNSGSSSSRADGSQASGHASGQPLSLRPLKAPAITLPSRGKKKRPLGHISSKYFAQQRPSSADDNLIYDGCEEESVSSTTSDRDSSCGDPRPLAVNDKFLLTPTGASSDHDSTSVSRGKVNIPATKSQDVFSSTSQDSSIYAQHHFRNFRLDQNLLKDFSGPLSGKTIYDGGYIPCSHESGNIFQLPKEEETWSQGLFDEKLFRNLRPQKDEKSDYISDKMQEDITTNESLPSVIPPLQPPIQRPLPQSQVLSHAAARSDSPADVKTWSSWLWSGPESYNTTESKAEEDIIAPSSDPWLDQNKQIFPSASSVKEDLHNDVLIASNSFFSASAKTGSQESVQPKHNHSNVFQPAPLSKDFGLVGSGKLKHNDPWSSAPASDQLRGLPSSLTSDVTYENESLLFPSFKTHLDVTDSFTSMGHPLYSSSTSAEHPLYSSSISAGHPLYSSPTYTPQSKTNIQAPISDPLTTGINSRSNPTANHSLGESTLSWTTERENPLPWRVQDADIDAFNLAAAESKTTETQTTLIGAHVEQMIFKTKLLKKMQARLESEQLEKHHLQETLKNCEEQLLQEQALTDKLKHEVKKLDTKVQIAENSAEKWRDTYYQLVNEKELLKDQNQVQADEAHKLNKQLEVEKTKFFNAQMEILELKKLVAINRIDMKKQEAVHHLQRLTSVITQANTVAKGLPDSVFKKHVEFSSYIASCENLNRHIEVIALRLKDSLKHGQNIDMSDIEVDPPAFPKPPSEPIDKPHASSKSGRQGSIRNGILDSPVRSSESESRVSSVPKSTPLSDEVEDEDSKAYLSMFCSDNSSVDSADSFSKLKDSAAASSAGTFQTWSDGADETKQDSFYAPVPASDATLKQAYVPLRPSSPALLSTPSGGVLRDSPGSWSLPGQRIPKQQAGSATAKHIQNVQLSGQKLQQKQQLPYFDRIVQSVQEKMPGYGRSEIQKLLDKLRRISGGSLSGWTFETLTNKILDMILDLEQEENLMSSADASAPDQHLSNSVSRFNTFDFICSICQSEIQHLETLTLTCGHKFHESCVNKWLASDRSCPNCRSHALLLQDFPVLK